MKAVLIGASGATGSALLDLLLNDSSIQQIVVLTRKPTGLAHSKLTELLIDFNQLDKYADEIKGDLAFSCLGTTLKVAGSKQAQYIVDYTYQFEFAKLAKANNLTTFVLVSAAFSDPNSKLFYARMKGELEQSIKALNFAETLIFKPGSLIRPNSDRLGENISVGILTTLNYIGLLKTMAPLHVNQLAQAMLKQAKICHANANDNGLYVYGPKEILKILNK